jgi:hypothetical protein
MDDWRDSMNDDRYFPSEKLSQFYMTPNEKSIPTNIRNLAENVNAVKRAEHNKEISKRQAGHELYNVAFNHSHKYPDCK